MNYEVESPAFIAGLLVVTLIGCVGLGIWVVWEIVRDNNRLKKC